MRKVRLQTRHGMRPRKNWRQKHLARLCGCSACPSMKHCLRGKHMGFRVPSGLACMGFARPSAQQPNAAGLTNALGRGV